MMIFRLLRWFVYHLNVTLQNGFHPLGFLLGESRVQTALLMICTKDQCFVLQGMQTSKASVCLIFAIMTWVWCPEVSFEAIFGQSHSVVSLKHSTFWPIQSKIQLPVASADAYVRNYMF